MTTISYIAVTAYGVPIEAFDDRQKARAWAEDHRFEFPGLSVIETTTTVTERTVWREKVRRVA